VNKQATVLVLGSGMAGLVAGYELLRRGCRPVILEARQRVGGRVHTVRGQAPGLYAEVGAMRIPRIHSRTLRYCEIFGLRLRQCVSGNPAALIHVGGHRITAADAARELPAGLFPLARHEQGWSNDDLWNEATEEVRARLSQTGFAAFGELALKYDGYSIRGFLKAKGWSEEAIERYAVLTASEATLNTGILQELREVVGGAYADTQEIAGGMDQLPGAFYPYLKEHLWLGTRVTAITQDDSSVTAHVTTRGGHRSFRGDYAICTIPFPVLRGVDIDPPFSSAKQKAIRQLHYDAATKIFFQVRRPFWEETDRIHGGTTVTDLPVRRIIYPSGSVVPGQRAMLLASYTWGQDALRWSALGQDQRIEAALRDVARIHPEVLAEFESGISYSWSQDPYAMGGYALFEPDQQTTLGEGIRRSEGRVHFAGEHCSSWPAWIEGAVESGQQAAERIAALTAAAAGASAA
jgi:monoamine oxidase